MDMRMLACDHMRVSYLKLNDAAHDLLPVLLQQSGDPLVLEALPTAALDDRRVVSPCHSEFGGDGRVLLDGSLP